MGVTRFGVFAYVCLGVGLASRTAHAQIPDDPPSAAQPNALTAPPRPPAGVTLPPQPSEGTPVPRLPPASPMPGYEASSKPPKPSLFAGRPWYGDQILISDAITFSITSVGVAFANANSSSDTAGEAVLLGFGGFTLAAPIIHGAHERWGIATASLSMRFFTPLVGALIGAASSSGNCPGNDDGDGLFCGSAAAIDTGFLGGMILASALDIGLFSYEKREPEAEAAPTFGIAPAFSADGKRGELRAFGTF